MALFRVVAQEFNVDSLFCLQENVDCGGCHDVNFLCCLGGQVYCTGCFDRVGVSPRGLLCCQRWICDFLRFFAPLAPSRSILAAGGRFLRHGVPGFGVAPADVSYSLSLLVGNLVTSPVQAVNPDAPFTAVPVHGPIADALSYFDQIHVGVRYFKNARWAIVPCYRQARVVRGNNFHWLAPDDDGGSPVWIEVEGKFYTVNFYTSGTEFSAKWVHGKSPDSVKATFTLLVKAVIASFPPEVNCVIRTNRYMRNDGRLLPGAPIQSQMIIAPPSDGPCWVALFPHWIGVEQAKELGFDPWNMDFSLLCVLAAHHNLKPVVVQDYRMIIMAEGCYHVLSTTRLHHTLGFDRLDSNKPLYQWQGELLPILGRKKRGSRSSTSSSTCTPSSSEGEYVLAPVPAPRLSLLRARSEGELARPVPKPRTALSLGRLDGGSDSEWSTVSETDSDTEAELLSDLNQRLTTIPQLLPYLPLKKLVTEPFDPPSDGYCGYSCLRYLVTGEKKSAREDADFCAAFGLPVVDFLPTDKWLFNTMIVGKLPYQECAHKCNAVAMRLDGSHWTVVTGNSCELNVLCRKCLAVTSDEDITKIRTTYAELKEETDSATDSGQSTPESTRPDTPIVADGKLQTKFLNLVKSTFYKALPSFSSPLVLTVDEPCQEVSLVGAGIDGSAGSDKVEQGPPNGVDVGPLPDAGVPVPVPDLATRLQHHLSGAFAAVTDMTLHDLKLKPVDSLVLLLAIFYNQPILLLLLTIALFFKTKKAPLALIYLFASDSFMFAGCNPWTDQCTDLRGPIDPQSPPLVIGLVSAFVKLSGALGFGVVSYLTRLCYLFDVGIFILALWWLRAKCFKHYMCSRHLHGNCALVCQSTVTTAGGSIDNLCKLFAAPPVDLVELALGVKGCWRGSSEIPVVDANPVQYSLFSPTRLRNAIVLPMPATPGQASVVLYCMLRGVSVSLTHNIASASSVPPAVSAAKSGGFLSFISTKGFLLFLYLVSVFLVNFVPVPSSCGVGTYDPYCRNIFATPVQHELIHGSQCPDYCYSSKGVYALHTPVITVEFQMYALAGTLFLAGVALCIRKLNLSPHVVATVCLVVCFISYLPAAAAASALLPLILAVAPFTYTDIAACLVVPLFASPLSAIIVFFGTLACILLLTFGCSPVNLTLNGWFATPAVALSNGKHPTMVTPHVIHAVLKRVSWEVLAASPPDTYLGVVYNSFLSGKSMLYVPKRYSLEGKQRVPISYRNVVEVVGTSTGSGALFLDRCRVVLLTSAHIGPNPSFVYAGKVYTTSNAVVKNDFACYDTLVQPSIDIPALAHASPSVVGARAWWLTMQGIEPGFLSTKMCIAFTHPGDSGSVVVDEKGSVFGVHTGSNQLGSAAITTWNGNVIALGDTPLSLLAPHYSGPPVPPPVSMPEHIISDVPVIPADLYAALSVSMNTEACAPISLHVTYLLLCMFFAKSPLMVASLMASLALVSLLPRSLSRAVSFLMVTCGITAAGYPALAAAYIISDAVFSGSRLPVLLHGSIILLSSAFQYYTTRQFLVCYVPPEPIAYSVVFSVVVLLLIARCVGIGDRFIRVFYCQSDVGLLRQIRHSLRHEGNIKSGVTKSVFGTTVYRESLTVFLCDVFGAMNRDYSRYDSYFLKASNLYDNKLKAELAAAERALRQAADDGLRSASSVVARATLENFLDKVGDVSIPIGSIVCVLGDHVGCKSIGCYSIKFDEVRHDLAITYSIGTVLSKNEAIDSRHEEPDVWVRMTRRERASAAPVVPEYRKYRDSDYNKAAEKAKAWAKGEYELLFEGNPLSIAAVNPEDVNKLKTLIQRLNSIVQASENPAAVAQSLN